MAENFDLIFGQNASQQYAWNDTDYENGWETIGNIPPTAAQFDALQRRSDTKMKELNDELTPLVNADTADNRQASTAYSAGAIKYTTLLPTGWYLECTVAGITSSGDITLPTPIAENTTVTDGTVTWTVRKPANTADIPSLSGYANRNLSNLNTSSLSVHVVINSSINTSTGSWYRLYDDGFIIQGGKVSGAEGVNAQRTINYPHSMTPLSIAIAKTDGTPTSSQPEIISMGTTSFVEHTANTEANTWTAQCAFKWIATGKV